MIVLAFIGKVGVRSGGETGCHRAIMPSFHVQRKMWGTGVLCVEWDFSVEDCLRRSGCRGARERHEVPRISFRSSRSTIDSVCCLLGSPHRHYKLSRVSAPELCNIWIVTAALRRLRLKRQGCSWRAPSLWRRECTRLGLPPSNSGQTEGQER